jgi:NAD(P)-dependent dehydrogenase (short-subunit alcohol dehydrogenase family)
MMERGTALVTGATSGIGFHTAQALAARGSTVFVTGRHESRGIQALEAIRRDAGHDRVHFLPVDHSSVGENLGLAQSIAARCDRLQVLVNNVGFMSPGERRETIDGYEATLAVNFVGPSALTRALLPLLRAGAPARVVDVISSAYAMWKGDPFADLRMVGRFVAIQAYARAKLLNLLWTLALARRLEGSGIVANATNPGGAWTAMTQALTPAAVPAWRFFWPIARWIQRRGSAEKAAWSSIYLASADEAAAISGRYFESDIRPKRLPPGLLNVTSQERAWDLAAELVAQAPSAQGSGGALR